MRAREAVWGVGARLDRRPAEGAEGMVQERGRGLPGQALTPIRLGLAERGSAAGEPQFNPRPDREARRGRG
jgi:hypothetical protein